MLKSSYMFMSTIILVVGLLISISSSSWFGVWLGLELNMLAFVSMVSLSEKSLSEAAMKYFLVQSSSSFVLLLSGMSLHMFGDSVSVILTCSILFKLGGAPFHFWLPMVAEGMSWINNMVMATLQKLVPFSLMAYMYNSSIDSIYVISILWGSWAGAMGGINEMFLRKLLSFSAINHSSWVILGTMSGDWIWLEYFVMYSVVVIVCMSLMSYWNLFHLNHITNKLPKDMFPHVNISFLSLGGLPPLLGFLPKWLIIDWSVSTGKIYVVFFLVCMSVVTLYFYSRAGLVLFSLGSSEVLSAEKGSSTKMSIASCVNLFGMIVGVSFFSASLLH